MLEVSNLNYASEATVIFQRLSVIITDLLLFYAIHTFARARAPWLPSDHKHSRTTLVRHTHTQLCHTQHHYTTTAT